MKIEPLEPDFEVMAVNRKTGSRRIVSSPTTKEKAEFLVREYVALHGEVEEYFQVVPMNN